VIQGEIAHFEAYNSAIALLDAGQYNEAIAAFTALGDYKDSVTQIEIAKDALELAELEERYNYAVELIEAQQYRAAYTTFVDLGDYKDSQDYVNSFIMLPMKIDTLTEAWELKYNAAGLLIEEYYTTLNMPSQLTTYTYSESGVLQKVVKEFLLSDGTVDTTHTSTYNEDGTRAEVLVTGRNHKLDRHYLDTYTYDEHGNEKTGIRVDTDLGITTSEWQYTYTFDETGNILKKTKYTQAGATKSSTVYEYTYNQEGQILYVDIILGNSRCREEYTYDYWYVPQN
jgi:hypothetical protein